MNFDKYIGLPYQENGRNEAGVDCWGLARLIYKNELNIELPDYSDLYSGSWDEQVTKLINQYKDGWIQVGKPDIGDLCLFNIYGEPAHIGIYVGDNKFLHSRDGSDSAVESLGSHIWRKRFQGFFKYNKTTSDIQLVGAPHPLKVSTVNESWAVPGSTLADIVKYVHEKYKLGKTIANRLVLMLDGVPIPEDKWATTKVQAGQQVTYRVLARGRGNGRLLVVLAVFIVTQIFLQGADGGQIAASVGKALGVEAATAKIIITAAVMTTATILQNVIAPIVPPKSQDPGSPNQLGLFNGSSNQANRYGAIPLVLGRIRYVGLLGATPYIESLQDSSILNLLIIWGFGPLEVSELYIGGTKIDSYYDEAYMLTEAPKPLTLIGSKNEDPNETKLFDKRYPKDVEQLFEQVELTNSTTQTPPNPWATVTFTQPATQVEMVFTFPEGLRKVKTAGDGAGKASPTTATIEIEVSKATETFAATPSFTANPITTNEINSPAFVRTLPVPYIAATEWTNVVQLFRWYTICLTETNEVVLLQGSVTDNQNAEASQSLKNILKEASPETLIGVAGTESFVRLPVIPGNHKKLWSFCIGYEGVVLDSIQDHRSLYTGYTGLTFTQEPNTDSYSSKVTEVKVSMAPGTISPISIENFGAAVTETIFRTTPAEFPGTNAAVTYKDWDPFLKQNGIWIGNQTQINLTKQITIPETKEGWYDFKASVDDEAIVMFGGTLLFNLPFESWRRSATERRYLRAGTYSISITAKDTGGNAGFAMEMTYTKNSVVNRTAAGKTILTVGQTDYVNRKDPFNYVYKVDVPEGIYKVRARRVDPDDPDNETDYRKYHRVVFSNATSFANQTPLRKLPRDINLARTVINVQSTSKVNGSVDGVNGMVQTIAWDWDNAQQVWRMRPTNNPASLFLYVLMHPANAYSITNDFYSFSGIGNKVDLDKLKEWHIFCETAGVTPGKPRLAYNAVLTSTQSVMDTLKSICAAGLASPSFVDGKWSVVIDKPRNHVVQHFTPHNSWGFSATKVLPRLPHAFRVTFQDEEKSYQANEIFVYNYGYAAETGNGKLGAEIYEELNLPGVTNKDQAYHLGRWHLAQLKLRPEQYTINTDFEHLVCTRGDLVRVTHDIPMWGSGSGRIRQIISAQNKLVLSEEIYLEAGKNYRILIRTNNLTATPGSGSIYKNLGAISTTGYYDEIIVSGDTSGIEVDNLFMLGELNKETQQLVVISVEPADNLTARISLVDYSPEIYSTDLTDLLVFNANITSTTGIVENTITSAPEIVNIISDRNTSQQISIGTYQTSALVTFTNPANLGKQAVKVQFEMVPSEQQFNTSNPDTVYITNKETGNFTFSGLETGIMYKVRARYTNADSSVIGPWSSTSIFVAGASGLTPSEPTLEMDLDNTYIIARVPQTYSLLPDFQTFEYRLYKDTGIEDFWDLEPNTTNNIKVIRSTAEGRFNLLDLPTPRLSETGISYRVACRAVNRNNEYSAQSALGTIVIKTIT